jgi:hypothetical protein
LPKISNFLEGKIMARKFSRFAIAAVAAVALISVIAGAMALAQDKDLQAGGGRLEGPWNVRVSLTNCQTGEVIRSFDSVTQFMQGGTLIDSTSGVPQALKTPGQGIWAHTADSTYRFKFNSFSFDAAGNYTGYTIIEHEATLSPLGNSYESSGTAEIYSPTGVLVATGCSSTVATRSGF